MPDLRPGLSSLKRAVVRAVPGMIALVLVVGVGAGVYFGYEFITTSERFSVQSIEVRGNRAVPTERISSMLGVREGDNIFSVALGALSEQLETEPMIAQAQVSRRLPDTLVVDIEEHEPAALVEIDGLYLADDRGQIFKRAAIASGEGVGLPVITGLQRAAYVTDPAAVHTEVRRALDAAEIYAGVSADSPERPALGEVNLHPRHGITFTTYERAVAVRVGHGDDDDIRANLQVFDIAWQALTPHEKQRARIVYADTKNRPDRVTVGFEHVE